MHSLLNSHTFCNAMFVTTDEISQLHNATQRYVTIYAYWCSALNRKAMELPKISIHRRMDTENVSLIHNGNLFSYKEL